MRKLKSEWKCGKCGIEYTTDELLKLKKVKMVDDDPDPWENYGFTSVCECGYVFHKDKWHKVDYVIVSSCDPKIVVCVSTVFLELNHGWGNQDLWYETMIFDEGSEFNRELFLWFKDSKVKFEINYMEWYETKEEAEEGHKKVVDLLVKGRYEVYARTYELSLDEQKHD